MFLGVPRQAYKEVVNGARPGEAYDAQLWWPKHGHRQLLQIICKELSIYLLYAAIVWVAVVKTESNSNELRSKCRLYALRLVSDLVDIG